MLHIFHKTNIAAMALAPLILVLPDSGVATTSYNVVMGIALPLHGHIGMTGILTDYVPKLSKGLLTPARYAMVGLTAVTVLGLLKHNLAGDGMTKSLKALWRQPEKKD